MTHTGPYGPCPAQRAARLLVALLLLLAWGCRSAALPAGPAAASRGTAAATPQGPAAATPTPTPAGRLLVGLAAEDADGRRQATFRKSAPVVLVLIVQNRGKAPARFSRPSAQLYDFWIEQEGQEVWRWSAGRAFAAVVTEVEIPVGETRVFRETWTQTDAAGRQVAVGSYAARGALLTGGAPLSTPPFRIAVVD